MLDIPGPGEQIMNLVRSDRLATFVLASLGTLTAGFAQGAEGPLKGLPSKPGAHVEKIKELHRYWFDTGIPLVVDLSD